MMIQLSEKINEVFKTSVAVRGYIDLSGVEHKRG